MNIVFFTRLFGTGVLTICAVVGLTHCTSTKYFDVRGTVAGAEGEMLYLEHEGLSSVEILDSVELGSDGNFLFKEELPKYTDYYRLRLKRQIIPFSIDSMKPERLVISADAHSFATSYRIEGSGSSEQIRSVWLAQLDANVHLSKLAKSFNGGIITSAEYQMHRDSIIGQYKTFAKDLIFSDPTAPAAYYALFQQVDGQMVFNLYDHEDSRIFSAVANIYHTYWPENPRSEYLFNLALRSIAVVRKNREHQAMMAGVSSNLPDNVSVEEAGHIAFALPDASGHELGLSEVSKGKVALLVFSSMAASWAQDLNAVLAKLYQDYQSRGFVIYQVGLDSDRHIWQNRVQNLPWVNVRDQQAHYSSLIGLYNIQQLPTLFLLDRKGNLQARVADLRDLPALIEQLL